jgi:hypothetical protein
MLKIIAANNAMISCMLTIMGKLVMEMYERMLLFFPCIDEIK